MKVTNVAMTSGGLTLTVVPENVNEALLVGYATAELLVEPDQVKVATMVEMAAKALGFALPVVG